MPSIEDVKAWVLSYYPSLIGAAALLVAGAVLIKIIDRLFGKGLAKSKVDHTMHHFLRSSIKIALIIILTALIASALKVPTGPLVASLSAIGLAVSLAVKAPCRTSQAA